MQHTDKMRAEFEALMAKEHPGSNMRCWGSSQGCEGCDDYEDDQVSKLWQSWKESRAAIEAAGVTVKE
ncbi:hypothetical protein RT21_19955 [Pseudomonas sp. 10B238]|uniref:hypothetical protein n=1 Tax=Pseudomonas sp. 10B238 TaxID=1586417 RepID=UPI00061801D6|nr:hypothetical protein [Pseudomonas sp. 10B238]KJJ61515.1 hypothetical protein RT21_19955 [Pseudomonas sp. 10B238]